MPYARVCGERGEVELIDAVAAEGHQRQRAIGGQAERLPDSAGRGVIAAR